MTVLYASFRTDIDGSVNGAICPIELVNLVGGKGRQGTVSRNYEGPRLAVQGLWLSSSGLVKVRLSTTCRRHGRCSRPLCLVHFQIFIRISSQSGSVEHVLLTCARNVGVDGRGWWEADWQSRLGGRRG